MGIYAVDIVEVIKKETNGRFTQLTLKGLGNMAEETKNFEGEQYPDQVLSTQNSYRLNRGKAFCVINTKIHGYDNTATMVETANRYDARLPNRAFYTNIPGVKTVPLVIHCPRSRLCKSAEGEHCDENDAIRWRHSETGDALYIDGVGRIHYRS